MYLIEIHSGNRQPCMSGVSQHSIVLHPTNNPDNLGLLFKKVIQD